MIILNLGCGTKTSPRSEVVNIDLSVYLRLKSNRVLRAIAPHLLTGIRRSRFEALPDNILAHDLSKGIPYASDTIDVAYHSHVLEHMDRNVAPAFLREIRRVLKPGGIVRIVVPDFALLCRNYLEHLAVSDSDPAEAGKHDSYVAELLEQSVRREAFGTTGQPRFRRVLENALLGDARRRNETHQWAYDRINLRELLARTGYREIQQRTFDTSLVQGWPDYALDTDEAGNEYKPGSLYMEARK